MPYKNHILKQILLLSLVFAAGCTHINATRNSEQNGEEDKATMKASFIIAKDLGISSKDIKENQTLVILALSGGGSRAAYWSSEIMLKLGEVFNNEKHGNLDLLKEVDVISSVSGGSLPAAYYAISKDPCDSCENAEIDRLWDEYTVRKLMSRDYITRWFYNWFWPTNIAQYWFTSYDRSDIMAQTFADNMFDNSTTGWDLKFKDINPERPNLILNATNGSGGEFGEPFTFTIEDFHTKLGSQLSDYDIAWAVMATASFPAVFNYMTLENFRATDDKKYVHVFDGGNTDNLGLKSAKRVIENNDEKYKQVVVILVDAYTESRGVNRKEPDARKYFDFVVDTNFLDSTDSLLANVRGELLSTMKNDLNHLGKKAIFYHIGFNDIKRLGDAELYRELNGIATNFKIGKEEKGHIEEAAKRLITADNKCLVKIKSVILNTSMPKGNAECHWPKLAKGEKH